MAQVSSGQIRSGKVRLGQNRLGFNELSLGNHDVETRLIFDGRDVMGVGSVFESWHSIDISRSRSFWCT